MYYLNSLLDIFCHVLLAITSAIAIYSIQINQPLAPSIIFSCLSHKCKICISKPKPGLFYVDERLIFTIIVEIQFEVVQYFSCFDLLFLFLFSYIASLLISFEKELFEIHRFCINKSWPSYTGIFNASSLELMISISIKTVLSMSKDRSFKFSLLQLYVDVSRF